jgi:type I restriction enzyme S subunit
MQYSVVGYYKTRNGLSFRLDAEYYNPNALLFEKRINQASGMTLKELGCKVVSGPFGSSLKSEAYLSQGIPFVRISDLRNWIIDDAEMTHISEEDHSRLSSSRLRVGDLVLSKVGNTIGIVSIVTDEIGECNISENNIGIRFPKLLSLEHKRFILAFLNSNAGQSQILRAISGNAQPKLNVSDIETVKVPVFQSMLKPISKLVETSISMISESKRSYRSAEQIVLKELGFLDWKPKRQLSFVKNFSDAQSADRIDAEYFQPVYDDLLEKVRHYKNGYKLLGDIVTIRKCIEPGSQAYEEDGIPFLRVSNLSKFGIINDNQQYISEELYEKLKKFQPQKGEILFSKDATPGIAYYLNKEPDKMIPSGGILRLNVKDVRAIYPEYLTLMLNSVVVGRQIERDIGGSVINHWLVDQVKRALIPILPESIQKDISDKVTDSFMKREQSKKLLDIAKRGVELAIEKSEEEATRWINTEVGKCQITM